VSFLLGLTHSQFQIDVGGAHDGGGLHVPAAHHDLGAAAGGDAGAAAHGQDAPAHHPGHGRFPINITTVMSFLTWFGAVGFLLRSQSAVGALVTLLLAVLAGLLGAAAALALVVRLARWAEAAPPLAELRLPGTLARVSLPIRDGGIGEIIYSKGGVRLSDGARSVDGRAIPRGTEVVILRYEQGIAYVEPFARLLAGEGPAGGRPGRPDQPPPAQERPA